MIKVAFELLIGVLFGISLFGGFLVGLSVWIQLIKGFIKGLKRK